MLIFNIISAVIFAGALPQWAPPWWRGWLHRHWREKPWGRLS